MFLSLLIHSFGWRQSFGSTQALFYRLNLLGRTLEGFLIFFLGYFVWDAFPGSALLYGEFYYQSNKVYAPLTNCSTIKLQEPFLEFEGRNLLAPPLCSLT